MDYLKTTDNGGFPFLLNDIRWDNEAERQMLLEIVEAFKLTGVTKFKVSGCVVSIGGGNISTTSGLIYLDSQIIRVEAHSIAYVAGTHSFQIVETDDPDGAKEFQNGTTYQTYKKLRGVIHRYTGGLPADELDVDAVNVLDNIKTNIGVATTSNSGHIEIATSGETQAQVVSDKAVVPSNLIANTTQKGIVEFSTDAETQTGTATDKAVTPASLESKTATTTRSGIQENATTAEAQALSSSSKTITPSTLSDVNGGLLTTILDIGDWNMDSTSQVSFAHGLTLSKIREIKAIIRRDDDAAYRPSSLSELSSGPNVSGFSTYDSVAGRIQLDSTTVYLDVFTGTGSQYLYNNTDFDKTSYNRGWVIIKHIP